MQTRRLARDPVLFAAHPTVGHTSALRAIGARLIEAGHPVALSMVDAKLPLSSLAPEPLRAASSLPDAIRREGIEVLRLRPALATVWHASRIAHKRGIDELEVAVALFTTDMVGQARAIAAHVERFGAKAVVADYLMPAAFLGARLAGRPVAAIYHSALPFPVPGQPPFGSGLSEDARGTPAWRGAEARLARLGASFDARVRDAARALGVRWDREGGLLRPMSDDLNLLATTRALEPDLGALEGPVVLTGPCLPRAGAGDPSDPALRALPAEGWRVYVSLGTVFNGKPEVFDAILDGLEGLGAHVVVSAGASFAHVARRARADRHVFARVPQVPLLAQVDTVITHGGNNTVQESLAAGCTMVVIPFGGDQIANARRIERLGVGVALPPERLSAATLREAARRAAEPSRRARAKELAATLDGVDGAAVAAEAIRALLERQ